MGLCEEHRQALWKCVLAVARSFLLSRAVHSVLQAGRVEGWRVGASREGSEDGNTGEGLQRSFL